MDRPDLYICHTAYHLLIALLRARRAGGPQEVWLSEEIPDAEALARMSYRERLAFKRDDPEAYERLRRER